MRLDQLAPALSALATIVTAIAAAWIGTHTRCASRLNRARLLSLIADEAATAVLANNPHSPMANLAVLVTQQVAAAAGHNITNARAIERAAIAALVRAGAKAKG